jgi:FKBP-type peptidyl-prolyl cis-trans isomerase FkpA
MTTKQIFRTSILVLLGGVIITSCNKAGSGGYSSTDSGLEYQFFKQDEKGVKPKNGDYLKLEMVYTTGKDSVLFDTRKTGQPVIVPLEKPTFKGGPEEGFAMLAVGDSASFIVNADSLYLKTFQLPQLPPFIVKGSKIKFFVKLLKIQNKEDLQKEQMEKMEKQKAEAEVLRGQEEGILQKYLADNKITTTPTESGLIFIEVKKGNGPKAEKGKKIKVNYTGRTLDGKVFDTSDEKTAKESGVFTEGRPYGPLEFQLGSGQVIPGWEEGLGMMNVGQSAKLIIPSKIAYGENQAGPIKPFSTLVFDVTLVSIEK